MAANDLVIARLKAAGVYAELAEDRPGWTNTMLIKSETSNKKYRVAQNVSNGAVMRGQWGCDCLGYIMSAKRNNGVRGCKHLTAMRPVLEAVFPSHDSPAAKPVAKRLGR